MFTLPLTALTLGALLFAAHTPQAVPSPSPSAAPALPAASPSVSPSAEPLLSPSPLPTPVVFAPDAPPAIVAVRLNRTVVRSGDVLLATVITSTNVAAVEFRVSGYNMRMTRGDAGVWHITYVVPNLPFWTHKKHTLRVVAMNTAGVETAQDVDVWLK